MVVPTVLQTQTAHGLRRQWSGWWFERVVRLVCKLGMQLQMRQSNCDGAVVGTFWSAVIVVCLVRYAISAMRSMVLTPCVFM